VQKVSQSRNATTQAKENQNMTSTGTADVTPVVTLDTSGLLCPLPVYRAALALKGIESGEVLELICTDPGSLADVPALARQTGGRIVDSKQDEDTQVFWIEKGPGT
jgi:tRNA 2-thiouridine synthesizing protein A